MAYIRITMRIYTKTGDKGNTSLYDGTKVSKDDIVIDCIGGIDELNSDIGCVISFLNLLELTKRMELKKQIDILVDIQSQLFDLGGVVACPNDPQKKNMTFDTEQKFTKTLETAIDEMTNLLPKLTNFILPGGSIEMSMVHRARTACRNAERRLVHVRNNHINVNENCLIFLNRLSDYLFTLARFVGKTQGVQEVIYKRNR